MSSDHVHHYRTKPGGIALVTHLERIKSDGSPAEPDRWAAVAGNYSSSADLMNFLRGLFFAKTGHYRLIVFIMQDTPVHPLGAGDGRTGSAGTGPAGRQRAAGEKLWPQRLIRLPKAITAPR